MINDLRGEFTAELAGTRYRFDTTLGTIARMEAACGDRSITAVIAEVVSSRRAADQIVLLTAALAVGDVVDAARVAQAATVPEAESFVLALMGALGFRLAARAEPSGADKSPLDGAGVGAAGASSLSAA